MDDEHINCEPVIIFLTGIILIIIGWTCDIPIFFVFGSIFLIVLMITCLIVILITCCSEIVFNVEEWCVRRRIRRIVAQKRHKITVSKVEKIDKDTLCTICQDNIPKGKIGKRLGCQHAFHSKCIDKWLEENDTCPNCRYISVELV